ncbi:MAG TPA: MBL fold metallo-hydrolase [Actinomycetota bacterium]|nr:MBL fold metallo-hydrolase [Actinomycetota bacterium]
MTDFSLIDTKMHGMPEITAAFLVVGRQVALVETGPKSVVGNVFDELDRLGIDRLDWILVTHIHLDHAGAAGTLAERFPDARVGVHEVGAPHLADPSKLWKSASRIYGERMEKMWGGIDPIPQERIEVLDDGREIDLGGRSLKAIETPGHAYHHHAFLDSQSGTLFTGDALGVRLPGVPHIRPATPPPEFHLEKAVASIERIRKLAPAALAPTHFGPIDGDVESSCDDAVAALETWANWVQEVRKQTDDLDEAAAMVERKAREDLTGRLDDAAIDRLEQTTSFWMNTWGYMRYFDKQEEGARGNQ